MASNGLMKQEERVLGDEAFPDLETGTRHNITPTIHSRDTITQTPTLLHKLLSYPTTGTIKLSPTSYLNGVRGIAALLVYIFHAFGVWYPLVPAWRATATQTNILQLPFIRTVFVSGGAAVSVFFTLSGYVLTHKSLYYMRIWLARQSPRFRVFVHVPPRVQTVSTADLVDVLRDACYKGGISAAFEFHVQGRGDVRSGDRELGI